MLHILISSMLIISSASFAKNKGDAVLVKPIPSLFSHKNHLDGFKKSDVTCTNCHSFSIKGTTSDPLGEGVEKGLLKADKKVCHECHLGKVSLPRSNQCTLCHSQVEKLMPLSHQQNWKFRHGKFAQTDPDSCKECHTDRTCTQCHTQRDTLKPNVHRPNFRMTHSIEARANPQSCAVCHSNSSYCIQCHTRGLK